MVSLPAEQRQDWPRFREATVAWLRQQYGERLRSVVEHTDEAHPICTSTPCLCRGAVQCFTQDGRPQQKKARQGAKGAQNAAYKQAMVGWQDGFQGP